MEQRAVFAQPFFRRLHIIIETIADIPKSLAVIGLYHMGTFMGGDIIKHKRRGRNEPPAIRNIPLALFGNARAPARAGITYRYFTDMFAEFISVKMARGLKLFAGCLLYTSDAADE